MVTNVIDNLSDPTIETKIELIKFFLDRAKKGTSNIEFKDIIADHLEEREKIPFHSYYSMIGSKYGLGCLTGRFLYYYASADSSEKELDLLKNLLSYVKGFRPSKSPLLKMKDTVKLIDIISEFGLPTDFLMTQAYQPLKIYYIPYQHVNANAVFFPYLNSVASYRPKQKLPPEYIFIHEIGHLLAFKLTGDSEKLPESFLEFNKVFNPNWEGDLIEVFVDLFSMAIMMDTKYAAKNPFLTTFSLKGQKAIKDYFIELVRTI